MSDRADNSGDADGDAQRILSTVFAAPRAALGDARRLLDAQPTPLVASIAHQVIGIVQREFGDIDGALTHLRQARGLARRSGSRDREGDVCATLGVALVQSGRARQGLAVLDRAVTLTRGAAQARVRFRRAGALRILGRHEEAMAELNLAIPRLRRGRDLLWTARAVTLRGGLHLRRGVLPRARADFEAAERMFARTEHPHDSAIARQNIGCVALAAGDLPTALRHLAEAGRQFRALGTPMYGLVIDRCTALLAAGLATEAMAEAGSAIEALRRQRGQVTRRADLTLLLARAALAAGEYRLAADSSRAARLMLTRQQRLWWSHHARLLEVQADLADSKINNLLLGTASSTAYALQALGSGEAAQAYLAAGRCALALGRQTVARQHLVAAARHRHRGTLVNRISGWAAVALLAGSAGDSRRLRRACAEGLRLVDQARVVLGAAELRALISGQAGELALLAQRDCVRRPGGRDLLAWTERWRAASLAAPPPPRETDPELARMLASYRAMSRHAGGLAPPADLAREQRRLERDIRERIRQVRGWPGTPQRWKPAELLEMLGDTRLLQIVEIDRRLYQVLCGGGRIKRFEAAVLTDVDTELTYARSALRRLAFGRPGDMSGLHSAARKLASVLIGQAGKHLGDGPIVVVPPARLHGVPWALLPGLADRELSVAPSATAWLRARQSAPAQPGRVALIRGPGLGSHGELAQLIEVYPEATVLDAERATVAAVLDALAGSSTAHIAAHGAFRADNPLFSSLALADGPMIVHDMPALRRAPHRLVLSSCESAALAAVGTDELLGLAMVLLPLGTASIVASSDPVNDGATATLMIRLHEALHGGAPTMAAALQAARRAMPDDPVSQATAASFVAIGAG